MLCNGKRTNYDAEVLVQASGKPHAGILTHVLGRCVPTGLVPATGVDEPARHIRKVALLVEYRPVFAW
jgi:hypothetical protein